MTTFYGFPQNDHSYSADEVGRALAGLVQREGGVPKVGALAMAPEVSAVPSAWKIQVGVFTYVHQELGAVQFSGVSASEQLDIEPASSIPVGQSRIDLLCWDPENAALSVIEGDPSVSPEAPDSGSLAPIAEVRVVSGDGAVIQGQIVLVMDVTGLASGKSSSIAGVVPPSHVAGRTTVITQVSFPAGSFDAPPVVVTGVLASAAEGLSVSADNITKDGFSLRRSVGSIRPGGYALGAAWQAMAP